MFGRMGDKALAIAANLDGKQYLLAPLNFHHMPLDEPTFPYRLATASTSPLFNYHPGAGFSVAGLPDDTISPHGVVNELR